MIKVTVKFDDAQLKAALKQFSQQGVTRAAVRALNKAATNVRAESVRIVRERRALPAKTIRDGFSIRRASPATLTSVVTATGRPVPLRDYQARATKKGVTARVVRTGPRKRISHKGNKAFLIKKLGDHVFARETSKRLPIKKLYGPSIPTALASEAISRAIETKAADSLSKRLQEELLYEMRRARLK
jgi:hypothetical protein